PKPEPAPQKQARKAEPEAESVAAKGKPTNAPVTASIEDIIAEADDDEAEVVPAKAPEIRQRPPKSQPVLVKSDAPPKGKDEAAPRAGNRDGRPLPAIVARAEAAKGRTVSPGFGVAIDNGRRAPTIEPRRDNRSVAAA